MRWLLVLVVAACSSSAPAPPGGAQRLVSLTPSASEIVGALGMADQLVGVDQYSTYPPEVASLPKVGSFLAPNVEAIVRLRPTLVIVDDVHKETAGALHDANLATAECKMHDLADVKAALRSLGDQLGRRAQADATLASIDAAIAKARAAAPAKRPRVLAIIDREANGLGNLVGAGPSSWLDELLAIVGGDNVLAASPVMYPKISMEEVLRAKPEVIIDVSYGGDAREAWRSVEGVPAVRDGRVVGLDQPYLRAPSPRIEPALAALAVAVRGR